MKFFRLLIIYSLSGVTLTPVLAADSIVRKLNIDGKSFEVAADQVLVKFKDGRGPAAVSMYHNDDLNFHLVKVPAGETIESYLKKLKQNPDVEFAEPNGLVRALAPAPNDPQFSSQYYLQTGTGGIDILNTWDITTGSVTTVVAVLDSGVLLAHADISNNLWVNTNTSPTSGVNGARIEIDWNGDGDCLDTDPSAGPDQCAGNDPNADDVGSYHGTQVAGIIAATTNNNTNMAGICQNCRIMVVKVLNSSGNGTFASIAAGITYAVNNGAKVINMSLGGNANSAAMASAVAYAIQNNVVVVAASGNNGFPCATNFPAAISEVIAVGATNSSDQLASFSCGDTKLDLVAPGVGILSLTSTGTTTNNGTSFATPMVAAVAGLIRSIAPNMSVSDVTRFINFTANDLGASGFDTSYGFGRLNAYNALRSAQSNTLTTSNPAEPGATFAYPNPFNPALNQSTTIALPQGLGSSGLEIKIYRLSGEEVRTLTGTNVWNGRNDAGGLVASGLYFYFAKTSNGDAQGKVTVVK